MNPDPEPNLPESPPSEDRRNPRVESLGRFGNYFYSLGWRSIPGNGPAGLEYTFAELETAVKPEFTFALAGHLFDDQRDNDLDSIPKARFLNLFWINDGYKLAANKTSPVMVSTPDAPSAVEIESIRLNDFAAFLDALEAIDAEEMWTNRMVLEIAGLQAIHRKILFFKKAVERVGWKRMQTSFDGMVAGNNDVVRDQTYLDFYLHCITPIPVKNIPDDLMSRFTGLIDALDFPSVDPELLRDIARQLARIDLKLACGFSRTAITTLKCDREDLVFYLQHCFPRHSQWWLVHTLKNPGLGPEQVADALNVAGTAASIQGQPELAMLSYEAALYVDPKAQSAAWNLGWLCAGLGEMKRAGEAFRHVTRHYPQLSLSTNWPQVCGSAWPSAPMDCENFELPPGITAWPRISVITPSFNQGQYIEETILSVLNQGYPNLQYIIVDGASTDETGAVLERYRNRVDHLIIERDNGQTQAINKGLRLVDGELVAWLNSDDMYAPGTLHRAALAWLENHADVIAGICAEHEDHRVVLMNKPAGRNAEFNLPQLARIFRYWFQGHYFFQPEVFFSRRLLDVVGLLDESLHYAMDYDLWVRFSEAGASLEVLDWPFAFFRKHDAQKTTNRIECIEEQARVRDKYLLLSPAAQRNHVLRRAIAFFQHKQNPSVGVLAKNQAKAFSAGNQSGFDGGPSPRTMVCFSNNENEPQITNADLVIMIVDGDCDIDTIKNLRASNPDRLIVGWFWRHNQPFENHSIAEALDFVVPAHDAYSRHLRNDQAVHCPSVPLCVTRWSARSAAEWFDLYGAVERSCELHGHFKSDLLNSKTGALLAEIIGLLTTNAISIEAEDHRADDCLDVAARSFEKHCQYGTSLVLPLDRELPSGVFDALIAGQIPLVPFEIDDLDRVIPLEIQESLPIFRFSIHEPRSVLVALEKARLHLSTEGPEGPRARHIHALDNHTLECRIQSILRFVGQTHAVVPDARYSTGG